MENIKNIQTIKKTVKNEEHIAMSGMMCYDTIKSNVMVRGDYKKIALTFLPDNEVVGLIEPVHCNGRLQRLSDGTTEFIETPRCRYNNTLIKKLPHGRISETHDGAILMTLKVYPSDTKSPGKTIMKEVTDAVSAINTYFA